MVSPRGASVNPGCSQVSPYSEQLQSRDVGFHGSMFETVVGRPITQAAPVTARRLLRRGTLKIYPNTSYAISGERPHAIAADMAAHLAR